MRLEHPDPHVAHPPLRSHLVQFYEEDAQLCAALAPYLLGGLGRGDPVVLVATERHRDQFVGLLQDSGHDVVRLQHEGRLLLLDAAKTLEAITGGGASLDPLRFQRVIGSVVEGARGVGSGRVRAFGEMVDLLWQQGRLEAALELEARWEELLITQPLTLVCSYRTSLLDAHDQGALERICGSHTDALHAEDRPRLDAAVERAFQEVVGADRAAQIHPLIEASLSMNRTLGQAERTLFWLQRNLPSHLDPVLDRARLHIQHA